MRLLRRLTLLEERHHYPIPGFYINDWLVSFAFDGHSGGDIRMG